MSKRRCLTCDKIKDNHFFTGRLLVCNDCKDGKTNMAEIKRTKVSTIPKRTATAKQTTVPSTTSLTSTETPKPSEKKIPKAKVNLAFKILDFADQHHIPPFTFYDEVVDLTSLSHVEICDTYTMDELNDLYNDLQCYLEDQKEQEALAIEASADVINQLDLFEKYKDGAVPVENTRQQDKGLWRQSLPAFVKTYTPNWRTASMEEVYENLKAKLTVLTGAKHTELFNFVCEFSGLVYEQEEEVEEHKEDNTFSDDVSESIFKIVEMIILPHVEVLDRLKDSGGNIIFADVWNEPFTEALKKEVKERDSWRCVICEDDVDLHVHHKIPRNLGGINHKDNLVTLCASCHGVIETADVQKAYKKCLANFRRKKLMGSNNKSFSTDKTLLKQEVEENLDKMLETLIAKDETILIEQLSDVMKRLEIIFYD